MIECELCGRKLKSSESMELGYGPVCYKKVFGNRKKIRSTKQIRDKNSSVSADELPYYDIPGQMSLEDFLQPDAE